MLRTTDLQHKLVLIQPLVRTIQDLKASTLEQGKLEKSRLGTAGLELKPDLVTIKLGMVFGSLLQSQDELISHPLVIDLEETLQTHLTTGKSELDTLPDKLLVPIARITLVLSEIYKARANLQTRYSLRDRQNFQAKSTAYETVVSEILGKLSEDALLKEATKQLSI